MKLLRMVFSVVTIVFCISFSGINISARSESEFRHVYISTFEELKEQLENGNYIKIILTCDIEGNERLVTGEDANWRSTLPEKKEREIILDLNGYTLIVDNYIYIDQKCSVTICDSGTTGTFRVISIIFTGKLTINSGRIEYLFGSENADPYEHSCLLLGLVYSELLIEGGELYFNNIGELMGIFEDYRGAIFIRGGTCEILGGKITVIGAKSYALASGYALVGYIEYDEYGRPLRASSQIIESNIRMSGGALRVEGHSAKGYSVDGTPTACGPFIMSGGEIVVEGSGAIGIDSFEPKIYAGTIISSHMAVKGDYYMDAEGNKITIAPYTTIISLPFSDVRWGAWYFESAKTLHDLNLMTGFPDGSFKPQDELSRAELMTLLYRMDNSPIAGSSSFEDVAVGKYYASAVAWAQENGIVNGTSDIKFSPNLSITREQIATILMRYADYKGDSISSITELDASLFDDYNTVSGYAKEAVDWAVKCGLISGKGDNKLDPKGVATRAETAAILHRFLELAAA